MSEDISSVTGSQALEAGLLPSNSPESQQVDLFGLPVALARLSALPGNHAIVRDAKAKCLSGILEKLASRSAPSAETSGSKTNAISGPKSGVLSENAALGSALGNRLAESPDLIGGLLYEVHWDSSATLLGPPICRLRASARHISGNGFSGWPTATAQDTRQYSQESLRTFIAEGKVSGHNLDLNAAAQLTGWPTPLASKLTPSQREDFTPNLANVAQLTGWPTPNAISENRGGLQTNAENALNRKEQGHMLNLDDAAQLSGWATPTVRDHKDGAANLENVPINHLLGREVLLTGWATPLGLGGRHTKGSPKRAIDNKGRLKDQVYLVGEMSNGSHAPTSPKMDKENTGQLNPDFSRWLMGFPDEWANCAPMGTR